MGGHRLHRSNVWAVRAGVLSIFAILLVSARSALGVPAFARKYGTSCLTCHTVYPKLNPFGEAFRRNGYRFPGVDSDFVKQEAVPLGQEAYKKEFPQLRLARDASRQRAARGGLQRTGGDPPRQERRRRDGGQRRALQPRTTWSRRAISGPVGASTTRSRSSAS